MAELLLTRLQVSVLSKLRKRLFGIGLYSFLLLLPLFLSGCGTVTTINKNESDLMPKSVAISIFEKYGYTKWVDKPVLYNVIISGGTMVCGVEKKYIEFNQIDRADYESTSHHNYLRFMEQRNIFSPHMMMFDVASESEALELTNAVRALGATNIDQMRSH